MGVEGCQGNPDVPDDLWAFSCHQHLKVGMRSSEEGMAQATLWGHAEPA